MAKVYEHELKCEAVQIALPSDQQRRQVASDLGVGFAHLQNGYRNPARALCHRQLTST